MKMRIEDIVPTAIVPKRTRVPDVCDEIADNKRREMEMAGPIEEAGMRYAEQAASIPTEPVPSVRDLILGNVREAGQLLTKANAAAFSRNPMSAEVPAFQELTTIAKRLNSLMQEIAKVRGL